MTAINGTDDHDVRALRCETNHREYIAITGDLDQSIAAGIDRAKLIAIIDSLTALAIHQFRYEEDKFVAAHYPNATTHKGLHKLALEMFAHFRNDVVRGDPSILVCELASALKGWTLLHTLGEDKQCGAFLRREASRRPWKEETFQVAA